MKKLVALIGISLLQITEIGCTGVVEATVKYEQCHHTKWLVWVDPLYAKFGRKGMDPLANRSVLTISACSASTVAAGEKCSLTVNRKSIMGFPTSLM